MNKLHGRVIGIESSGQVSLIDVECCGETFSAIVLDVPESMPYMRTGADVALMFKETEVSLARNLSGQVSLRNRFPVKVIRIDQGTVLSAVALDFGGQALTSVITSRAVSKLALVAGETVEALVKANEVMLGLWE